MFFLFCQCAEFAALIALSGIINEEGIDSASLLGCKSRGWCRLEHLAAVSPALDIHTTHRVPAVKLWVYDMSTGTFIDSPFVF